MVCVRRRVLLLPVEKHRSLIADAYSPRWETALVDARALRPEPERLVPAGERIERNFYAPVCYLHNERCQWTSTLRTMLDWTRL